MISVKSKNGIYWIELDGEVIKGGLYSAGQAHSYKMTFEKVWSAAVKHERDRLK